MKSGLESVEMGNRLGGVAVQQICSDVEAYYGARVAKYGATPRGVDLSLIHI